MGFGVGAAVGNGVSPVPSSRRPRIVGRGVGRGATRRLALRSTVTFVLGRFGSCEMTEKRPGVL